MPAVSVSVCLREIIRALQGGNLRRSAIRHLQTREAPGGGGLLIYQLKPSGRTFIAEVVSLKCSNLAVTEFHRIYWLIARGPLVR